MIKAIIFDWSGVLCDDLDAVYNADMAVFDAFGLKRLSIAEYRQQMELPWSEFYKKRGINNIKKISEVFIKEFLKHNSAKPIEGAIETLQWLEQRSIKMAVLSSKSKNFLLDECKQFGFGNFINIIESWSDKRNAIAKLVERIGTKKEEILFIGDMCHDIETAKHASIKSVAVLSGYNTREKLLEAKPDYLIQSIGELPALIETIGAKENARVAADC